MKRLVTVRLKVRSIDCLEKLLILLICVNYSKDSNHMFKNFMLRIIVSFYYLITLYK